MKPMSNAGLVLTPFEYILHLTVVNVYWEKCTIIKHGAQLMTFVTKGMVQS